MSGGNGTQTLFKENMRRVYLQGDAFMRWYILAHVGIALLLAVFYHTWQVTLAVSAGAALIFYLPERFLPGSFLTRMMAGLSLQLFVLLYIYQMHGLAEMHFFFFTGTTAMIIYQDWRALWLGVAVVIVQHTVFALLINTGTQGLYYFEQLDYIPWLKLTMHLLLAAAQSCLASYFAFVLRERTWKDSAHSQMLTDQAGLLEKAYSKLETEDRRKASELQKARDLQQSILPSNTLSMPGFEMMVSMEACTEVGGDYYDYYIHPNGKVTIALGDATGHGMQAAIVVAACKSLFQTFVRRIDIAETFRMISEGIENLHLKGVYMGLTLVEIEGHAVRCVSSGMPPVMLFKGSTGRIMHLSQPGPFIGHSNFPLHSKAHVVRVENGDKLLLSTDGLYERFDKGRKFLGYKQLQEKFESVGEQSLSEIMDSLILYSAVWQNGHELLDDTTVLLAQFRAHGAMS